MAVEDLGSVSREADGALAIAAAVLSRQPHMPAEEDFYEGVKQAREVKKNMNILCGDRDGWWVN